MNRNLVNSKLDKYRERGKGTYTFCQVGCDCNIAVNLLEEKEKIENKYNQLQSNWNSLREYIGEEWYCFDNESVEHEVAKNILDKMNELGCNNFVLYM